MEIVINADGFVHLKLGTISVKYIKVLVKFNLQLHWILCVLFI
jgi:hypothetical protein